MGVTYRKIYKAFFMNLIMDNRDFRIIDDPILMEIMRKKQLLEMDPSYHLNYSNGKKKALRKEANRHSVSLEMVGYETATSGDKKIKSKEQRRCTQNLSNAMDWGLENYDGVLSERFVEDIGRFIEPDINEGGYRSGRTRITGSAWSPPSPEKIEREMRYFIFENESLDNIIEKAAHAHFHIARIHPFSDGNGRTARAIQNILLEKNSFLPVTIKLSERLEYSHLLDAAVGSYRMSEGGLSQFDLDNVGQINRFLGEGESTEKESEHYKSMILDIAKLRMGSEQKEFYNFIGLKLRDSQREVADRLYHNRK
jgi:Fic family protein